MFSPDGHTLVSGGYDSRIHLWDLAIGEPKKTFRGHARGVDGVAFSLDGTILASASNDGTILLWDITSITKNDTD
jgi:WD40 repeat protein